MIGQIEGWSRFLSVTSASLKISVQDIFLSKDLEVCRVRSISTNSQVQEVTEDSVNVNCDVLLGFKPTTAGIFVASTPVRNINHHLMSCRGEIRSMRMNDFLQVYFMKAIVLPYEGSVCLVPVGGCIPVSWWMA